MIILQIHLKYIAASEAETQRPIPCYPYAIFPSHIPTKRVQPKTGRPRAFKELAASKTSKRLRSLSAISAGTPLLFPLKNRPVRSLCVRLLINEESPWAMSPSRV
jgi:hypothetical protein